MMEFNKKGFAVLLALSLGMSGAALAASADSFSDVPKDHWSYEALDYLAKEGVIEGMGNSTFEGGRTMTRYEVASIVAKAMQKGGGNFGDKTVLENCTQNTPTKSTSCSSKSPRTPSRSSRIPRISRKQGKNRPGQIVWLHAYTIRL